MDAAAKPAPKPAPSKAAEISVLHCLNPDCGGLLAYEVEPNNVLHLDLAWTAKRQGETRFFPCPKCGARNIVEEHRSDKGKLRHRVTRWER